MVNSFTLPSALSFARAFPLAFEMVFFFNAVTVALAKGDINAQSNLGDVDPPALSSTVVVSTFADDVDILMGGEGPTLKTKCGGLRARITFLLRDPGCIRL